MSFGANLRACCGVSGYVVVASARLVIYVGAQGAVSMYCPRCGVQNRLEQKFCRQCGLSLPGVRLALESRLEDATAKLKEGYDNLGAAVGTLGFFLLAVFINFFLWDLGVIINLVLGLLITGRWFRRGFKQLEQGRKMLDLKEALARPATNSAVQTNAQPALALAESTQAALPPVPDTDPLAVTPAPVASVTEHTTLTLKQPEPR